MEIMHNRQRETYEYQSMEKGIYSDKDKKQKKSQFNSHFTVCCCNPYPNLSTYKQIYCGT